uniref:Uncharacterized protein n=1 Tax=Anopheles culicifacies TaxID=139723 RepID=A0A182LZ27_9DIPT
MFPGDSLFDDGLLDTGVVASTIGGAVVDDGIINFTSAGSSNDASSCDGSGLPAVPPLTMVLVGIGAGTGSVMAAIGCECAIVWRVIGTIGTRSGNRDGRMIGDCAVVVRLRHFAHHFRLILVPLPVAITEWRAATVISVAVGHDILVAVVVGVVVGVPDGLVGGDTAPVVAVALPVALFVAGLTAVAVPVAGGTMLVVVGTPDVGPVGDDGDMNQSLAFVKNIQQYDQN